MKIKLSGLKILAICAIALANGGDFFGGTQMTKSEKSDRHGAISDYIKDLAQFKGNQTEINRIIDLHKKFHPSAVVEAEIYLQTGRSTSGFSMDLTRPKPKGWFDGARAALGIPDPTPAPASAPMPAVALAKEGQPQLPKKDVACGTADDQGQAIVEEPSLDATIAGPMPRLSGQPSAPAQSQEGQEEHDPDDPAAVWREVFDQK